MERYLDIARRCLGIALAVLAVAGGTRAAVPSPTDTPLQADGVTVVAPDEAAALVASTPGLRLFDMRNPINYGRGHLPGATSLPYRGESLNRPDFDAGKDRFDSRRLPDDRGVPMLFYSHGDTGWKSFKAALTSVRLGYRRVYWLRAGYAGWVEAGLPTER